MDSDWILVIALWGGLIAIMLATLIPEFKKTPEQRAAHAEKARERGRKRREEEKRKRQELQDNTPTTGCPESTIRFGILCVIVMIALIVCIMLLIASGD